MNVFRKIFHLINSVIRRGYWFNNIFFSDCRKFEQYKTFNTDVINLGTSSAVAAFNYEDIKIRGGNWALSKNPLIGDLAVLKNYSSYLKENKSVVIISLCPFSSLAGSYDYFDDRYYRILYPTTIPHYSYNHYKIVQEKWNHPIKYYPTYAPFFDIFKLIFGRSCKILTEKQLEEDANIRMKNWLSEFSISDFSLKLSLKNQDAIADAAEILNQIISFCRERQFKVYIVIPPMYCSLSSKFTSKARKILIEDLLEKINDRNVPFYNYMDDMQFINDKTLFKDSFLMNKKGAKMFTRRCLMDIGLI